MVASSVRLLAAAAGPAHRLAAFRHAPIASSLSFPRNPHHGPSFRGRASFSSVSLPLPSSSPHASVPFNLFPPDSEPFIQWDPPPPDSASPLGAGGRRWAGEGPTLVVLLGWLGARQKHLRRYADLYRERGIGSVRFVVPVRELVGLDLGRCVERRVADLAAEIAAWCDADRRRTLLFHTFSNTGWLAFMSNCCYGGTTHPTATTSESDERKKNKYCAVPQSRPALKARDFFGRAWGTHERRNDAPTTRAHMSRVAVWATTIVNKARPMGQLLNRPNGRRGPRGLATWFRPDHDGAFYNEMLLLWG